MCRIRFENGCVANITASRISQDKLRKIRALPAGRLSLARLPKAGAATCSGSPATMRRKARFLGKILGVATDATIVTEFAGQRIVREPVEIDKGEPLKRELAGFIACARAGAQPKVSGHEATAALELALEITRLIEAQNRAPTT